MTEEDFFALENSLREQFDAIGAPDLADPRAYLTREGTAEPTRMRDTRDRLLQMLEAFDRRLAIEDGETFEKAMAILRQSTDGPMPERVLVEPVSPLEPIVDLSTTPSLTELRARLRELINNLAETPYTET